MSTLMHFLLSYGSNLCTAQLLRRCPGAQVLGTAVVPGWRLAFGGYSVARKGAVATIERGGQRAACSGVVAALSDADLIAMDACEGAGYERVLVEARARSGALAADGRPMMVQTYMLRRPRPGLPHAAYVRLIAAAYATWGFDVGALTAAVNRSVRDARGAAKQMAKLRGQLMLPTFTRPDGTVDGVAGHVVASTDGSVRRDPGDGSDHALRQCERIVVLDDGEREDDGERAARMHRERMAVLGVVKGRRA